MKQLSDVDLGKNQLLKPVVEKLASAPTNPVEGMVYYDTTLKTLRYYTGTIWIIIPSVRTRAQSTALADTIASATKSYLSSSGRHFTNHSGTGSSTDACAFSMSLDDWLSGGKVYLGVTSGNDGVKFMVWQVQISINDGGAQVQETVTLPKILTANNASYPLLTTGEVEFSSTVLNALGNGKGLTFKVIRNAGHADDDYNSAGYLEFLYFKYNY